MEQSKQIALAIRLDNPFASSHWARTLTFIMVRVKYICNYYLPYILIDEAGSRINMAHFNSRINMYYYGKQKDTYSSKIHNHGVS